MTDIVERLREEARWGWHIAVNRQADTRALHTEAADEIEKLRREWSECVVMNTALEDDFKEAADEIERLRAVLKPTKPIGYVSPNVLKFLSGGAYRQGTICNYESDGEIPLYATTPPTNEALAAELLAPLAEAIERTEKAEAEIERLQDKLAKAVEALKLIMDHPEEYNDASHSYGVGYAFYDVQITARSALKEIGGSGD